MRLPLAFLLLWPLAAGAGDRPLDLRQEEQVQVRLVLVDVLVTDRSGRTVPGLTRNDFTLLVQNSPVEIDTLDTACRAGAMEDPRPRSSDQPFRAPAGSGRIVLLFDHHHMDMGERLDTLSAAREIVAGGIGPGVQVMVAVLTDGLRILQPFTSDPDLLTAALDSMEQDVTIWARLFDPPFRPLTESGYFEDLSRLLDVLGGYDGAKAVVLFSAFLGRSDDNDLWFLDVAHRAAESRSAIYPVYARGLEPPQGGKRTEPAGGSRALARLANESGGRFTRLTNDLSLGYARALRDLACRYTLGFYLEDSGRNQVVDSRNITVRVRGSGRAARHPERLREWTPADLRAAAVQAAEADPERYLDPGIAAGLEPLRPRGERNWKVRLTVSAPAPGGEGAATVLVARNRKVVKRYRLEASAGKPLQWNRTVRLPPGEYELIVVLDDPARPGPSTGLFPVRVPDPPGSPR